MSKQNYKMLNVGCGNDKRGTDRVDIVKTKATTKVYDITKGLPYKQNYFDEVYCSYVFEHMGNPLNLLLEMKRVCKVGGMIKIVTDNAGYIFTHMAFRGLHGNYSDKSVHGKKFNTKDRHYMLYTPEHLRNFSEACNLHTSAYGFTFWENVKSKKSIILHKAFKMFLGKRFIMPSVYLISIKI